MGAVDHLRAAVGVTLACAVLGLPRSSYRRHRRPRRVAKQRVPARSHRRISDEVRGEVVQLACSERFVDAAPATIVATLLDDDARYLCSTRTMYRILDEHADIVDRRHQRRHPAHAVPELVATAPNMVWTWDITRLPTTVRGQYLYLYLILDLYSRAAVGWMVADRESAQLAERLVRITAERHAIGPQTLTLHADRGAPMTSKTLATLLADLEIKRSFSRPRTSDDNPFVESVFKTTKYHPRWPGAFESQPEARAWADEFFGSYNHNHRHTSLLGLTPAVVYQGLATEALERRHQVHLEAFRKHPERFPAGPPRLQTLPQQVTINCPSKRPALAGHS